MPKGYDTMKKISAFVVALFAGSLAAQAGGMNDPIVEDEPVAVAAAPSSSSGGLVVLLLLGLAAAAVAGGGTSGTCEGDEC